jgi:hypothetical protein
MEEIQPSESLSLAVAPSVIFRSRPIFTPRATLPVGLVMGALFIAIVVVDAGAWRWAAGGLTLAALGAAAWVVPRYKLVTEFAQDDDMLLVRTMFQRCGSPTTRIPIAEAADWREYVELRRGYGLTTIPNRIIAFRHHGVFYGMAIDHAELLDRNGLALIRIKA